EVQGMSNVVKMPKHPCPFCKKNDSTQLCDFVIGTAWTTVKDEKGHMIGSYYETCDNEMCKECASLQTGGYEYCPSCQKLHEYVQKNHVRRPRPMAVAQIMGRYGDE
ncbi:hypothetical protein M5X02_31610, partial [Paenibacillus alvei]